jgi:hypothetical protein
LVRFLRPSVNNNFGVLFLRFCNDFYLNVILAKFGSLFIGLARAEGGQRIGGRCDLELVVEKYYTMLSKIFTFKLKE